jgi:hypothetical protein
MHPADGLLLAGELIARAGVLLLDPHQPDEGIPHRRHLGLHAVHQRLDPGQPLLGIIRPHRNHV